MADVSIIIPVYNVEDYIDRCLKSVVNQTFSDIEIIVINDGSTDGSGERCLKWAKRDKRVRYVYKDNEGAGPARNLGIRMATADFVAFCDPDDWYDERYIEVMRKKQQETNADIVICKYCYWHNDGLNQLRSTETSNLSENDVQNWTWRTRTAIWVKMFKKSLFLDYDIMMPDCLGQDTAIHYYIMTKARKVVTVDDAIYYWYRRPGSATNSSYKHTSDTVRSLKYGWDMFIKEGVFDEYKDDLLTVAIAHIINKWYFKVIDDERYASSWLLDCITAIEEYFGDLLEKRLKKVCVVGSFSLCNSISGSLPRFPIKGKVAVSEFWFTGLISYMSSHSSLPPSVKNHFRQVALNNDFKKRLVKMIKNYDFNYVILDFLDERFDIAEMAGGYYTISDAFLDADVNNSYNILDRTDPKVIELWKNMCLDFISILNEHFSSDRIILVRNYLAESFGTAEKQLIFDNIAEIKQLNAIIKECYEFFEENCPGVKVIDCSTDGLLYSDEFFRHGCLPWHYNSDYYNAVRCKILDCLGGE